MQNEIKINGLEIRPNIDIVSFTFYDNHYNGDDVKYKNDLYGIITFCNDELRYEIDIYNKDNKKYVCLSYDNNTMSNFKIIGNIFELENIVDENFDKKQLIPHLQLYHNKL